MQPVPDEARGPVSLRFPRALRIRTSREYRVHRARSRVFRTKHFLVSWAPGLEESSRLGLTVSKKVGGSPQRNRVKRLLREWFRLHRHELRASWDLVLIARRGAPSLRLFEVEAELSELVRWLDRKTPRRRATQEAAPPTEPGEERPA